MIRATLVLLAAHLVITRLRRQSAAERHALWAACLATAALLPLLTLLMPAWQPEWARRIVDVLPTAFGAMQPAVTNDSDIIVRATGIESGAWTLSRILAVIWIAGSVTGLLVLIGETMKLRRLSSSARLMTDTRAIGMAAAVARSLDLTAPPRLLSSARATIPIAWGARHAHILLPDTSRDWPDDRLWAVLAHEMAHLRRGDWTTHLLAELVCVIYWFHPLFWLTRTRLGRESERAADDLVLGLGASGTDYASHLLEIVRAAGRTTAAPAPTVAMARRSDLEGRIASLLNQSVNRTVITRRRLLAIALVAIALAAPLAAIADPGSSMTIALRTAHLAPLIDAAGPAGQLRETTAPLKQVRVLSAPAAGAWTPPEVAEYVTPPLYSDEARQRSIEGIVTARARIDASGQLSDARVVKGLGFGLDQNALVALRQWRFDAGTRAGSPTAMDVEVEIEFTLRNEALNALIANDMATLVGPGITPPRAVRTIRVNAPAVRARGTVTLDVVLLENGSPRVVRILQSLTPEADERAVRAFEQWRFSPATKNGQPVKVRMNAEVNFRG